ncbi:MAG TPA: PAS domain-containing protein [Stellaceae bacterium]|nr:PAS domain-containing protein [Stellaceae bacterium]
MGLIIEQSDATQSTEVTWDPRLVEADRYWRSKCAGREMPRRADIDPTEIRGLLPHLMLLDIDASGRPKYRLIGTEVEQRIGYAVTGRYVDEIVPEKYGQYLRGLYDKLLSTRRPIFSNSVYGPSNSAVTPEFYLLRTSRYMAPLSSDGTVIDMVLACQTFETRPTVVNATVLDLADYFEGT